MCVRIMIDLNEVLKKKKRNQVLDLGNPFPRAVLNIITVAQVVFWIFSVAFEMEPFGLLLLYSTFWACSSSTSFLS